MTCTILGSTSIVDLRSKFAGYTKSVTTVIYQIYLVHDFAITYCGNTVVREECWYKKCGNSKWYIIKLFWFIYKIFQSRWKHQICIRIYQNIKLKHKFSIFFSPKCFSTVSRYWNFFLKTEQLVNVKIFYRRGNVQKN